MAEKQNFHVSSGAEPKTKTKSRRVLKRHKPKWNCRVSLITESDAFNGTLIKLIAFKQQSMNLKAGVAALKNSHRTLCNPWMNNNQI